VFGFTVAYEAPPEDADQATKDALGSRFGGVIYSFGAGNLLGLRPVAPIGDAFDEDRVGLDHPTCPTWSRRSNRADAGG